jgi:hypothetical protein
LRWQCQRLKKIVKKSDRPLSLPLNDAAFGEIQAWLAVPLRYAHSNDDAKRRGVQRLRNSDRIVAIVPRTKKIAV